MNGFMSLRSPFCPENGHACPLSPERKRRVMGARAEPWPRAHAWGYETASAGLPSPEWKRQVHRSRAGPQLWAIALRLVAAVLALLAIGAGATGRAAPLPATAPAAGSQIEPRPATRPFAPAPVSPAPAVPATQPDNLQSRVSFNFQNAPVNVVLDYLSQAFGFIVLKSDQVTAHVTITSLRPVSAKAAVNALDSVLKPLHYTLIRTGRDLQVVALNQAQTANVPVHYGDDPARIADTDQIITQVVPVHSVDATKLRTDLTPLLSPSAIVTANAGSNTIIITDTSANIRRIVKIIADVDQQRAAATALRIYHLRYADATSTATLLNAVFNPAPTSQAGGPPPRFVPPWARRLLRQSQRNNAGGNEIGGQVNASADQRTNSLVVTGPAGELRLVGQIVQRIDRPAAMMDMRMYHLKNADATDTATLINAVFNPSTAANQPSGPPPPLFRRVLQFVQRNQHGATAGNAVSGQVNATADERTNTVIVTGPADELQLVSSIVQRVDSNPAAKQVFFIYHLKNASAANVQYVLNTLFGNPASPPQSTTGIGNAFGMSSGASGFGAFGNFGGATRFGEGNFGNLRAGNFGAPVSNVGRGGVSGASTATAANALLGQAYIVADTSTNSLLVTTTQKYGPAVKSMIRQLDQPVPQVLIKVLIAEVTLQNSSAIGSEFSILDQRTRLVPTGQVTGSIAPNGAVSGATGTANVTNFGSNGGSALGLASSIASAAANGTPSGLVVGVVENNFTATLQALAQKNQLDVLSRPYILASDNQQATMMVGQEVPIITNSTITTQGTVVNTPSYQQVGIILYVTPQINPDGDVTLNVAPQVSQLESGAGVTVSPGVTAPIFDIRQAQSVVDVKNGQTIVIGGLMQDQKTKTVSKVPLLGDIPWIGPLLFSNTQNSKTKTELLIFLTPHVIPQPRTLKIMSKGEERGMELVPKAVGPGVFQRQMKDMQRGGVPSSTATQPAENPVHDIKLSP